ncbi:hypothetical protein [Spartinivicinus ruber]|uniref:hypothetical protein n=1 Tax=Spartinivicinus ruber TaxID=2683272 RepID=UPI0013D6207F|nr:hypothetical protein [Spartinivicinus ruber]
MVVKSKHLTTLFITGCLSFAVFAGEKPTPDVERLAFQIAANELNKAVAAAGAKIEECKAQEVELSPDLFKKINLEKEKLFRALTFLSRKASAECTHKEDANFLFALSNWQQAIKHNPVIGKKIIGDKDPAQLSELITGNNWSYLRLNAEYLLLNEKTRQQLEDIPQLQKPFKLMDTLRKLGL